MLQRLLESAYNDIEIVEGLDAITYCTDCRMESVIQKGFPQNGGIKFKCSFCEDEGGVPSRLHRFLYRMYRGRDELTEVKR